MFKLPEDDLGARETAPTCAAATAGFLDSPRQPRFDRRRPLIDIRAIKAKAGFQPKRIPRAKSDRCYASICEQFLRDLTSDVGGN